LAGQIKNQSDIADACLLALQGRKFSEIEGLLDLFYTTFTELELRKTGKQTRGQRFWGRMPKQFVNAVSKSLKQKSSGAANLFRLSTGDTKDLQNENNKIACLILEIVLSAIKTKDSAPIFEIGKAIELFKAPQSVADPLRKNVLFFKFLLDSANLKMQIGELAAILKLPKESSLDGFSQLRRICRDLKFPLETSRQITKK